MKNTKYVFHRTKNLSSAPDLAIRSDKLFEDALFEFVFNDLGYSILKVESDSEIKVTEV